MEKSPASSQLENRFGKPPPEPTANDSRGICKAFQGSQLFVAVNLLHKSRPLPSSCFFQLFSLLLSCSFCFVLAAHLSRVICYSSMGLYSTAASHHCWPLPGWSRQLLLVKAALSFPLVFCNIKNTAAWIPSQGEQAELCSAGKVAQRKSLFPWRASQQLLLCI